MDPRHRTRPFSRNDGKPPSGDFHSPLPSTPFLRGEVAKIVYTTEDASYTVARIRTSEGKEFAAVGLMPGIAPGQNVELTGKWERHSEHGLQLRVSECHSTLPVTREGLVRYLSSGILKGVGLQTAQAIVARFGADTLKVLDNEPHRLEKIPKIGRKKRLQIQQEWNANTAQRALRIFLEGLGITPAYFSKIYQLYGDSAADKIRGNPYRLASEVRGIGFRHADAIAAKAGIRKNDIKRLTAGVAYAFEQVRTAGHTCMPRTEFLARLAELLEISSEEALRALSAAALTGGAVSDFAPDGTEMLYEPSFLRCENEFAFLLKRLLSHPVPAGRSLRNFQRTGKTVFSASQMAAVDAVSRSALSIITGGPGVGKTTIIAELVRRAECAKLKVVLAAPTGRAAKRLSEATRRNAATIHRLLKWDPAAGRFFHSRKNPLPADLFVIDEVSMLDLPLAVALFRAIPEGASAVMVGDPDQLPSVGPGNVLNDLIASGICPVSCLKEIFRQGEGSGIIRAARDVNTGCIPRPGLPQGDGTPCDFYWIKQDDPVKAAELLIRMTAERIPARFGFDPVRDIQVICPMNRGEAGTNAMNTALQSLLNATGSPSFSAGERFFKLGDKVMQTSNNYDKNVFNGDSGFIREINVPARNFQVDFDGQRVSYSFDEADQIVLAYAVTVHKSQGSEFPVVLMPLLSSHYMMLQRNLLYTGMTRARKLMVLVASEKAMSLAVRNAVREPRHSLLLPKLKEIISS